MKILALLILAVPACGGYVAEAPTTTIQESPKPVSYSFLAVSTGDGRDRISYYVMDIDIGDTGRIDSAFKKTKTSELAIENGADFAVNGDFFLYRNNGVIIRNGGVVVNKPSRDGMALTPDGMMFVYEEEPKTAQWLLSIGASNSFSFGPVLVADGKIRENLDSNYEVDKGRSISGRHPRTGICMREKGNIVFVVVDGRSPGYSRGVTLREFADIFLNLGCSVAYNLDGGGSSVMYWRGEVVNNPLGKGTERTNGDIIFVSQS